MKYVITCSLLLTLISIAGAQPVLTRNRLMMPGDDFFVSSVGVTPDPGPSGPQVVWNFAALQQAGSANYLVEDPNGTPFGAEFPGANLAIVDPPPGSPFYQYAYVDDNVWEDHGNVVPAFSTLEYSDPRVYLQFPATYQSQWQDAYEYTIEYQTNPPVTTLGEGNLHAVVDGYGSLILPQATFNDVLRIRITSESTDTSELGAGLYERNYFNDTTYVWFSASYYAPLCTYFSSHIMRITTVISGDTIAFPEEISFSSFSFDPMAEPSSALHDVVTPRLHALDISPNPFADVVHVAFHSQDDQVMQLVIRDLLGNAVYRKDLAAQGGMNNVEVDLPVLSPGTYLALLHAVDGTDIQKLLHIDGN